MRRGLTLVEMLVVLVLLGAIAGVATVAFAPVRVPAPSPVLDALTAARRKAIGSGRAVTITIAQDSGPPALATAWPDGRIVADGAVPLDPFTGRADATR